MQRALDAKLLAIQVPSQKRLILVIGQRRCQAIQAPSQARRTQGEGSGSWEEEEEEEEDKTWKNPPVC